MAQIGSVLRQTRKRQPRKEKCMVTAVELALFAEKYDWLVIEKSTPEDLKLEDDFQRFLTPQGKIVLVRYASEGKVKEIVS